MTPATFRTVPIPQASETATPAVIARAYPEDRGGAPLRVLVRNVGANPAVFAFELQDLIPAVGGSAFDNVPANQEDVFIVMPGQTLLAVATGGTSRVAAAISEAFPLAHAR